MKMDGVKPLQVVGITEDRTTQVNSEIVFAAQ